MAEEKYAIVYYENKMGMIILRTEQVTNKQSVTNIIQELNVIDFLNTIQIENVRKKMLTTKPNKSFF